MRKADGSYTYFVPDVAYHLGKWERGFVRVINEQGRTTTVPLPACVPGSRRWMRGYRRGCRNMCFTRW